MLRIKILRILLGFLFVIITLDYIFFQLYFPFRRSNYSNSSFTHTVTGVTSSSSISVFLDSVRSEVVSIFRKNEHREKTAFIDNVFYRDKMKMLGYDDHSLSYDVEDHFKSLYITAPKKYVKKGQTRSSKTKISLSNSSRTVKVITCFNCDKVTWFINNHMFKVNRNFQKCPYSECLFDLEANITTADIVLFFVGHIGQKKMPPRLPRQIWIKCYWEPPVNYDYPTPYEPWKSAFNWTFTYRTDSDIFSPINYLTWRSSETLMPDQFYFELARNKTRTAAWFVSSCHTSGKRENYVQEMQKHIDVDIYGKCGPLKCDRSVHKMCEQILTTTYKFYISFENSFCKDYVTEKFFRNFQHRSHVIPVVRGGFDYDKYFPNGILINAAHFISPKDLALYLKALGNDHQKYAKMLKEKDRFKTTNLRLDWCKFCEKVHTQTATKIIPDIREWSHKNICHVPADV